MHAFLSEDTSDHRQAVRRRRTWWGNDVMAVPLAAMFAGLRWAIDDGMAALAVDGRRELVRVDAALTCAVLAMVGVALVVTVREVRTRLREGFWFDAGTETARGMLG